MKIFEVCTVIIALSLIGFGAYLIYPPLCPLMIGLFLLIDCWMPPPYRGKKR